MYGGCSLRIGDDTVSPSDRIRSLGVHMDQHLTMTDHVTAVCAACNYHLYRLSSIRHYLTTEAAKSAVNALVTSRLDYCNSLLHNIPLSQTARLQRVQNNAARLITRTSKHDHITPALKELHWLPVESRIAFKMLCVVDTDCLNNGKCPVGSDVVCDCSSGYTGGNCALVFNCETRNPCFKSNTDVNGFYYEQPDPHKFIQCDANGVCYNKPCGALVYDPVSHGCISAP
ncbi:hypothetical protein LSAT2_027508 [Lamellibrachia satsuma]|nr:hypothetical protein LSAT2_027508 [Lamellibrachia satsuma]